MLSTYTKSKIQFKNHNYGYRKKTRKLIKYKGFTIYVYYLTMVK